MKINNQDVSKAAKCPKENSILVSLGEMKGERKVEAGAKGYPSALQNQVGLFPSCKASGYIN